MQGQGCGCGAAGTRQPLAASATSRNALRADGVGAVRPGACGEPDHRLALGAEGAARLCRTGRGQPLASIAASRYALGTEGVGAARPGAYMCCPPILRACLLGAVGMSRTSCAARCLRGSVQGLLRVPAEGEGGVARREDLSVRIATVRRLA